MDLLVLLLLCTAPLIRGYSSGLVIDSCEELKSHQSGLSPQTAPSPFIVTTEQRRYRLGEDVKVELQGPASTPFTGFLLEAIEVGSETPVGSFAIPAGAAKLLTCSQRPKSAGSISSANCGVTKVCFSQPSNCDPAVSSSCYFMSAMMLANGTAVQYEMIGPYEGYIAFGFSDDQKMGNDDIYVCGMNSNGQVGVQHMYSTGRTTPQVVALGNVYNITTSLQNNVISCSFTTTDIISIQGTSGFSQSYYFMFVHGPSSNGQIQFHKHDFVSTTKMAISTPVVVSKSGFPDIIKAHGSLMLIAWMTTGTLGMMVARYLKKMAKGTTMCNKDLWFVVHAGVMVLTVAATIIAFILIFSHTRDWSGGAHPVLGCLVMILSFFQPVVAMLRCGPQHHLRYLFNTSHFLNAVIIKSLAVAAIFTGLNLIDSSDGWLMKVMGGFLAWEALFYIMLEVHNGKVKIDGLLIGLFFLGNICFLVALLVGIGVK
ncbi:putative ferric-chelate reductase 1 [Pelmatolapia mariae]|uniref:putative ferric-chelate reductase 1 n=1 Tax=Pelmatolapia mariae TaxID=158779 RepID=UPI002FE5EC22